MERGTAKRILGKTLKWTTGIVGGIFLLVVSAVLLAWCFPKAILTGERVSRWVSPVVRFERSTSDPDPSAPMISIEIEKHGFFRRSIGLRLAPGCYSPSSAPTGGTEICFDSAELGFSFRLSRKRLVRLTSLDRLLLKSSRVRIVPGPPSEEPPEETPPGARFRYLRYLDRGFEWGPISIEADRIELPDSKITGSVRLVGVDPQGKSATLDLTAKAESPDWTAAIEGEVYENRDSLILPKASAVYRTRPRKGEKPLVLAGEVGAKYSLETGDLDGNFSAAWRRPTPEIDSLRADDGILRMHGEELSAGATVKLLLEGKTPLGRLPLLTVRVDAALRPADSDGGRPIDVDLGIDSYRFAGVTAKSDLSITIVPRKGRNSVRWRSGKLRIAAEDFGRTAKIFSRTAWAIPVPFNVFSGPIVFETEPFRDEPGRSVVPATLTTELKSKEQLLSTETQAELGISKQDFGIDGLKIAAVLRKVRFRLPDYDPLAPTPALTRDPRIVRGPTKKGSEKESEKGSGKPSGFPLDLSIRGDPGSLVFLNRYFDPNVEFSVDLKTRPSDSALLGRIDLARPFDFRYLNRTVTVERFSFSLRPEIEIEGRASLERSGYRILADFTQSGGKSRITLGSEPPLQTSEIVSLLLYGQPGNSITAEQTRSVGSTQAALSSDALGIFSFFAFASTPIQSVRYDPETQTYSAIVSLPGGVTASIGSNWENERQLALSKSLGKNWAVSTELIKDAQGVDRGGTLLRWRKTY